MEEENITPEQRREKVYNLVVEIRDMELKKKSTTRSYAEELKRLKAELKDLTKEDQQVLEVY